MIKFTREALERLTPKQRDAILTLLDNNHSVAINISAPFDLPSDYVYFVLDKGSLPELHGWHRRRRKGKYINYEVSCNTNGCTSQHRSYK